MDPRDRSDGLGWVTRAVFGDAAVRLRWGTGLPEGERLVAQYTVVPSAGRARFLLPRASRRVAVASMLAYNGLRPRSVRLARATVGAAAWSGLTRLPGIPVLTVTMPDGMAAADRPLIERVSDLLGGRRLHAALGVRPPDPNHKPTLQLFDDQGRPHGYAKVGWNEATRSLVRAEAAALDSRPRTETGDYPLVPKLLAFNDFGERVVAVVEPLPVDVVGLGEPDRPLLSAMLAISRRGGPAMSPRPVCGSPFLERLSAEAASMPDGDIVRAAVVALRERYSELRVEFGDWHGDWVPWNLGYSGGRLVAWDWEHSASEVPVGLDLAHEGFQIALILRGLDAERAAEAAAQRVNEYGEGLGLSLPARRFVVDSYLIEMWLRSARLAAGGAGWNPVLHPALPRLIARRLEIA